MDSYTEESLYRVSDFLGSNFQLEFILAVDSTGSDEDSYSIDEVIKQNMTNIGASSVSLKILLNRLDSYSIDWVIKQNMTLSTFRIPVNILESVRSIGKMDMTV
ncbi:hypothetical protein C5167_006537 [Papaver somniferum]|uniref:Uncharacterized protein n=1 Tax=Papaver somniferum TaxID=3469 RepID=A0A4Y7JDK5_PAPSO|nr:hypothetical protein C5167_006537 [Papaver somniferum]